MTIVADSGPILSCARANRLELFHQVIGDLTIPDAVYEDIVVRGAGKPGATLDELIAAGMYMSEPLYEAFLRQLSEAQDTQQP
jgi:predicted nucleic acid-binding protein